LLIQNAEINFGNRADVRITDGVVAEVRAIHPGAADERVICADGAALLPGLHDHHFHLLAFAASFDSVQCGPPSVATEQGLAHALRARQSARPGSWIRGVGYHQSIAGDIDRHWLDKVLPSTPARIQHRGGRLWILNSRALDLVASDDSVSPLENIGGRLTGRLYDADAWLRDRIGAVTPPIRQASEFLLSRGVTGITDTTPGNGREEWTLLQKAQLDGDLVQDLLIMGGAALDSVPNNPGLCVGARKIHLREAALPTLTDIAAEIVRSHAAGRPAAFHCVTLAELVFALGALDEAGVMPGDRIEHAAVAPPEYLPLITERKLTVVTQPNFVCERGDAYLSEVDAADKPWLYRLRAFLDAGIPLAGGTDAPFGNADPWKAMQAAVTRRTSGGVVIGSDEALTPEEALGLFTGELNNPGGSPRIVRVGAPADLCLIDRPWAEARKDLSMVRVGKTIKAGRIVWSGQFGSASTNPH
jgi:predicted amidohydrolase YtcJ